jgi:hypothetical protein
MCPASVCQKAAVFGVIQQGKALRGIIDQDDLVGRKL